MTNLSASGSLTVDTVIHRHYLSTHHLYAARYAAHDSTVREAQGGELQPFDIRNRAYVLTAVTASVSFLEAAVNELYQDAADEHPSHVSTLEIQCSRLMAAVWTATERGQRLETLRKYDLALACAGQFDFDRGSQPYQDVALLIRLRNYLIHYRPHDVGGDEESRLGTQLRQRGIAGSILMEGLGNPWFPDHALGAGCAQWAWRAARCFVDEFSSRMGGLRLNYKCADFGDPLQS